MSLFDRDRERLVEAAVTAHRAPRSDGLLGTLPAWHDLDEAGRAQAFEETLRQRALEAALDPQGFSSSVHAVLGRLAPR